MTHTDTPIFAAIMTGNHAAELQTCPGIIEICYEIEFDLTAGLFPTDRLNSRELRKKRKEIENLLNSMGLQPDILFYHAHGVDMPGVWQSLNLIKS